MLRSLRHRVMTNLLGTAAIATALTSIVVACAGNSSPSIPGYVQAAQRQSKLHPSSCTTSLLYVASFSANEVLVFDVGSDYSSPCATIAGLNAPEGLFVDANANLWVANAGTQQVLEFAPGGSSPILTLADPNGFPDSVAVDNKSGTVYVGNIAGTAGPGYVAIYPKGKTKSTKSLTGKTIKSLIDVAVDAKGNVYATFDDASNAGHIDRWAHGKGTAKDLGMKLGFVGGIETTKNGALVVCAEFVGCGDFERGSKTMTNVFAASDGNAFEARLTSNETQAFVPDTGNNDIGIWKYPGPDQNPISTFSTAGSGALALSPAPPEGAPW